MMEYTELAETTQRDRFMRAAEKEMAKFERREIEFRKKDRQERAAELDILALSSKFGTDNVR
jgi:diphthamide biosynthesis methyltransferase